MLMASAANANCFVTQVGTFKMAEYPTIAVLDNTDESFQITLNGVGTPKITACYEIVDQSGPRTFRNAFATTNGATPVELVPAPPADEAYRVVYVNGYNIGAGATRTLWLNIGTGSGASLERVGQMSATNLNLFSTQTAAFESPFPEIVLSDTDENLQMQLNAAGALDIAANYEVYSTVQA
jgi:hypothetical protein